MTIGYTRSDVRMASGMGLLLGFVFGSIAGMMAAWTLDASSARERGEKPKAYVQLFGHSCECVRP